jgi:rhodanese-related sulfurtransferase
VDFFADQTNILLVIVAITSAVALAMPRFLQRGARQLSVNDAVKLANDRQGLFLDIRSPEHFKAGSIPQSRNVPAADIVNKLGTLPKDRPIIVVCERGRTAVGVVNTLKGKGYDDVYFLEGGLAAWIEAGLPLARTQAKKH